VRIIGTIKNPSTTFGNINEINILVVDYMDIYIVSKSRINHTPSFQKQKTAGNTCGFLFVAMLI
jgi:hypothetical protein